MLNKIHLFLRIGGHTMDTETVRLNITLPKGLVEAMNRLTEPRKRSRFIAEAVRQKIAQK
jgi:metal-responsive CopG/Arc/MetJ family transcriptional regulator